MVQVLRSWVEGLGTIVLQGLPVKWRIERESKWVKTCPTCVGKVVLSPVPASRTGFGRVKVQVAVTLGGK